MEHAFIRRIHNPKGRVCYCDPDCWCRRTALGRLCKWWFPARKLGLHHKSRALEDWKQSRPAGALEDWKREQDQRKPETDR